jgi:type II secretory pathway pseudopilin PulG
LLRSGATVIEAIVVAVIVLSVALIAAPRLSRGGGIETHPAELESNLAVLRNAIRLYAAEHQGAFPDPRRFQQQLTQHSNLAGRTSEEASPAFPFGPYLREIPGLPIGRDENPCDVVNANRFQPGQEPGGWYYNAADGSIYANLADHVTDRRGMPFNNY